MADAVAERKGPRASLVVSPLRLRVRGAPESHELAGVPGSPGWELGTAAPGALGHPDRPARRRARTFEPVEVGLPDTVRGTVWNGHRPEGVPSSAGPFPPVCH